MTRVNLHTSCTRTRACAGGPRCRSCTRTRVCAGGPRCRSCTRTRVCVGGPRCRSCTTLYYYYSSMLRCIRQNSRTNSNTRSLYVCHHVTTTEYCVQPASSVYNYTCILSSYSPPQLIPIRVSCVVCRVNL